MPDKIKAISAKLTGTTVKMNWDAPFDCFEKIEEYLLEIRNNMMGFVPLCTGTALLCKV